MDIKSAYSGYKYPRNIRLFGGNTYMRYGKILITAYVNTNNTITDSMMFMVDLLVLSIRAFKKSIRFPSRPMLAVFPIKYSAAFSTTYNWQF